MSLLTISLNTHDIYTILHKNPLFRGVYPISDLPFALYRKPFCIVVNLDERWKSGSHWVTVFIPKKGPAVYFDSFGRYPSEGIITFMERNTRDGWVYSKKKLQGDLSTLCGFYCVMFVASCPNIESFFKRFVHCGVGNDKRLLAKLV